MAAFTAHNTIRPIVGTISNGTLRTADLLVAFGDAYRAALPTNGIHLQCEAAALAELLETDAATDDDHEAGEELVNKLQDELDAIAYAHGLAFSNTEGDGTDFGFWEVEDEADEDEDEDEDEADEAAEV